MADAVGAALVALLGQRPHLFGKDTRRDRSGLKRWCKRRAIHHGKGVVGVAQPTGFAAPDRNRDRLGLLIQPLGELMPRGLVGHAPPFLARVAGQLSFAACVAGRHAADVDFLLLNRADSGVEQRLRTPCASKRTAPPDAPMAGAQQRIVAQRGLHVLLRFGFGRGPEPVRAVVADHALDRNEAELPRATEVRSTTITRTLPAVLAGPAPQFRLPKTEPAARSVRLQPPLGR
ncbi:hypothetical protein SAMN05444279_11826 [Ruegeria intermedia]|uniref:Uncharacterized protein n=1 Tax=Ruegeria intermedia TaxID=996115 RepID=A0A1M4Z5E7_9RHOB|nr:hypothetical protein [Ruegeria intermedia]SHF13178.1 hypothetical protein SAMN05444279_11826 [Ruegeria intermedia]